MNINIRKIHIIISIIAISFCQGLQYTVSPVLYLIGKHFTGVNVSFVQMLITAPALLAMIVAVFSGWLVLKISKKKLLVFGCFMCGVTGFIPFLSDSFGLLFFSRTLYGIGLGLATSLNAAVAADFFTGKERVAVMGIQSASIGAGIFFETLLCGFLGQFDFHFVYFVHIIGFIAAILIALLLPLRNESTVQSVKNNTVKLNRNVFRISFLGMIEFLFLITFTTNIAMHLSGNLSGNTSIAGTLTGAFSFAQIISGLALSSVSRRTGRYTLPVAMLCFSIGAFLLFLFPSNFILLMAGAIFCGFSQGLFVPEAFFEIAESVQPVAVTMASACFTCGMYTGQLISPFILNVFSTLLFHEVSSSKVYCISSVLILVTAVFAAFRSRK